MVFEAIRRQLGRSVPFARLLGIEVETLDERQACTRLAAQAQLGNHVGTLHAGALFTLCEAASGAALAGAMVAVVMHTRFVVRDAQVEYLRPAFGQVLARARLVEEAKSVLQTLQRDGRADVAVDVSAVSAATDGAEELVARASFNWRLEMQTP